MAKPKISALFVTYNQKRYIPAAIRSICNQTCRCDEIIVSDDCSTDGSADAAAALKVEVPEATAFVHTMTEKNGGLGANLNNAFSRSQGTILIACAGDDISDRQRVAKVVEAFDDPDVYAVTTDAVMIDADGKIIGYELGWYHGESISADAFTVPGVAICGASAAYRREVFEFFGLLQPGVNWEDQVLPFRAALLGKVCWLKEPLIEYRRHGANMTNRREMSQITPGGFAHEVLQAAASQIRVLNQKVTDLNLLRAKRPSAYLDELAAKLDAAIRFQKFVLTLPDRPLKALMDILPLIFRRRLSVRAVARSAVMTRFPVLWVWYVRQ